jgi:hypothetical protein
MDLNFRPEHCAVEPGLPLSRLTTWRIGGPARYFCRVRTEVGLAGVLLAASADALPLAILGMGSNVLVADEGFPGYVLRLEGEFLRVAVEGERVTAGGGAALGGVCAAAARAGLSGIEALSGIPESASIPESPARAASTPAPTAARSSRSWRRCAWYRAPERGARSPPRGFRMDTGGPD